VRRPGASRNGPDSQSDGRADRARGRVRGRGADGEQRAHLERPSSGVRRDRTSATPGRADRVVRPPEVLAGHATPAGLGGGSRRIRRRAVVDVGSTGCPGDACGPTAGGEEGGERLALAGCVPPLASYVPTAWTGLPHTGAWRRLAH